MPYRGSPSRAPFTPPGPVKRGEGVPGYKKTDATDRSRYKGGVRDLKKEQERGARLGDSLRLYGGAYASPYYGAYGSYYGAYAASPYYSYGAAYASPYYSAYSHPYSYAGYGYGGYGYGRGYYY